MRFAQLVEQVLLSPLSIRLGTGRAIKMSKERNVPVTDEVRVLKYMRIQAGLSLRKAGQRFGITDGAISHIENGKMKLPVDRIEQMVLNYGFSMGDFLKLSRSKKLPNNRREECERLLTTVPNSRLEDVFDFLRALNLEAK